MFISKEKERTYQLARFGMSVGIAAAMLLAVYFRAGMYFESNDDRNITEILSGAFGGRQDAHTVYVNYWLSVLLSGLYRITLQIPWYGLMLLLFHMMSYVLILDTVIKLGRSKLKILISIGIVMTLFLQNFYSVAKIQYTSTAIVLAVVRLLAVCNIYARQGFLEIPGICSFYAACLSAPPRCYANAAAFGAFGNCRIASDR